MTTECPDIDLLLGLGTVLNWDTDGTLDHISSCAACRAQLRELAHLRRLMTETVAPRPGFAADVVRVLPTRKAESPWVARLALGLMASCTTAVALAAASLGTNADRMLVTLPFVSVLAGVVVTVWLGRGGAVAKGEAIPA